MKTKIILVAGAAAASLWAATAYAAETMDNSMRDAPPPRSTSQALTLERLGPVTKASELIGAELKNMRDEKLGRIDDLSVDLENGRVVQVVVTSGGVAGVGGKTVAVPPRLLKMASETIRLDVAKDKFQSAPTFDLSRWDEYNQTNRISDGYHYFSQEPYFSEVSPPNSAWPDRSVSSGRPARFAAPERASKVIGATVRNLNNESIGKVEDLVIDVGTGRIADVIVASGGFLGIGDEYSAVPPSAFQYNTARDHLQLNVTKDDLSHNAHFKRGQWPDFNDRSYQIGIYRAYHAEPYFNDASDNRSSGDMLPGERPYGSTGTNAPGRVMPRTGGGLGPDNMPPPLAPQNQFTPGQNPSQNQTMPAPNGQ